MSFSGIMSTFDRHWGHQARNGARPRRTRSDSVSIVILVNFAITLAFASPENRSTGEHDGSLPESGEKVFTKPLIISDEFSVSC